MGAPVSTECSSMRNLMCFPSPDHPLSGPSGGDLAEDGLLVQGPNLRDANRSASGFRERVVRCKCRVGCMMQYIGRCMIYTTIRVMLEWA